MTALAATATAVWWWHAIGTDTQPGTYTARGPWLSTAAMAAAVEHGSCGHSRPAPSPGMHGSIWHSCACCMLFFCGLLRGLSPPPQGVPSGAAGNWRRARALALVPPDGWAIVLNAKRSRRACQWRASASTPLCWPVLVADTGRRRGTSKPSVIGST